MSLDLHLQLFAERRRRLLSKRGRRSMKELSRDFPMLFTARGVRRPLALLIGITRCLSHMANTKLIPSNTPILGQIYETFLATDPAVLFWRAPPPDSCKTAYWVFDVALAGHLIGQHQVSSKPYSKHVYSTYGDQQIMFARFSATSTDINRSLILLWCLAGIVATCSCFGATDMKVTSSQICWRLLWIVVSFHRSYQR